MERPLSHDNFYSSTDKRQLIINTLKCPLLMSWPDTRGETKQLAELIQSCGCNSATSIGCGTGIVEWLLSEFFPTLSITGIDVHPAINATPSSSLQLLSIEAAWTIKYGCCLDYFTRNILQIPINSHDALMFLYPIPSSYALKYLASYKGNCLVVEPADIEGEVGSDLINLLQQSKNDEWKEIGRVTFKGRKEKLPQIVVFKRVVMI